MFKLVVHMNLRCKAVGGKISGLRLVPWLRARFCAVFVLLCRRVSFVETLMLQISENLSIWQNLLEQILWVVTKNGVEYMCRVEIYCCAVFFLYKGFLSLGYVSVCNFFVCCFGAVLHAVLRCMSLWLWGGWFLPCVSGGFCLLFKVVDCQLFTNGRQAVLRKMVYCVVKDGFSHCKRQGVAMLFLISCIKVLLPWFRHGVL